jgi:hypothetical protein
MLDLVQPSKSGMISLGDLKRCHQTPIFFDTFFNLEKYLEHEHRDPFAVQARDPENPDQPVSQIPCEVNRHKHVFFIWTQSVKIYSTQTRFFHSIKEELKIRGSQLQP